MIGPAGTFAAPRESGTYRCTNCGEISGWFGMLVRSGIRENCARCLPKKALVGTMKRVDIPAQPAKGETN